MRLAEIKKKLNYRRGNGYDGYCRDCRNMRKQPKLFGGKGFLNCIKIGLGTKNPYYVKHDYTCNAFEMRWN